LPPRRFKPHFPIAARAAPARHYLSVKTTGYIIISAFGRDSKTALVRLPRTKADDRDQSAPGGRLD
jgi:hypothetical protein